MKPITRNAGETSHWSNHSASSTGMSKTSKFHHSNRITDHLCRPDEMKHHWGHGIRGSNQFHLAFGRIHFLTIIAEKSCPPNQPFITTKGLKDYSTTIATFTCQAWLNWLQSWHLHSQKAQICLHKYWEKILSFSYKTGSNRYDAG